MLELGLQRQVTTQSNSEQQFCKAKLALAADGICSRPSVIMSMLASRRSKPALKQIFMTRFGYVKRLQLRLPGLSEASSCCLC